MRELQVVNSRNNRQPALSDFDMVNWLQCSIRCRLLKTIHYCCTEYLLLIHQLGGSRRSLLKRVFLRVFFNLKKEETFHFQEAL